MPNKGRQVAKVHLGLVRALSPILPRTACLGRLVLALGIVVAVAGFSRPAAAQRVDAPRIAVSPSILAEPASQTALQIQVGPPGALPSNSFIRLRGLPASVSLSEGHAIAPGLWAIPLFVLPSLKANVPAGITGRSEILIQLVGVDGTTLAEGRTTLLVAPPAPPPVAAAPVEPTPPPRRSSLAPAPPPVGRPLPRTPELSAEDRARAERLVAQGDRHLEQGNIGAARLFFQRAAEAGSARAAIRLAATYDPAELGRLQVQGVNADRNEARRWYERARDLGAPEADERLSRLAGS
jgi:hypothetical protein